MTEAPKGCLHSSCIDSMAWEEQQFWLRHAVCHLDIYLLEGRAASCDLEGAQACLAWCRLRRMTWVAGRFTPAASVEVATSTLMVPARYAASMPARSCVMSPAWW